MINSPHGQPDWQLSPSCKYKYFVQCSKKHTVRTSLFHKIVNASIEALANLEGYLQWNVTGAGRKFMDGLSTHWGAPPVDPVAMMRFNHLRTWRSTHDGCQASFIFMMFFVVSLSSCVFDHVYSLLHEPGCWNLADEQGQLPFTSWLLWIWSHPG